MAKAGATDGGNEIAARRPGEHPGRLPGASFWLARVSLSDFRSYDRVVVESDARPLVLTGPNGAGKTNLLEAVSLLTPGRGLRRARLEELGRRGAAAPAWAVAAEVMTPDGPRSLGTGRDGARPEAAGERRVVKVDGDFARSQQVLSEILHMVWLTPQMDGLFRDGASARRRFLDRLVYGFDPAHAGRIAAYEQSLRQRARLLKSRQGDGTWLDGLEQGLAERGVAIAAARRELVSRLNQACAAGVGPFPRAAVAVAGEVEDWLAAMPALSAEETLRDRLAETRARDTEGGGAAVGPHRSDLAVSYLESGLSAAQCSTGEQKALLLSIVLAHGRLLTLERGAAPILLLDEVAAHLDAARRAALFDELLALGAQAWLTGTDAEFFAELGDAAQFFEVREARVRRAA
jgi:DNA replication and repair protein RecF